MKNHNQPFRLGDKVVVQGGNTFDISGAVKTEGIVIEVNESVFDESKFYTVVTPYKFAIFCGCTVPSKEVFVFEGCDLYSTNAVPNRHQKLLAQNVNTSDLRVLGNLKE